MSGIHSKIKTAKDLATRAFVQLNKIQTGQNRLVKTGRPYIDKHLGGLLPSSVLLIGASSGTGKSLEAMRIMKGVMSEEVNEQAGDYVSLEFMLEMKFLDLVLRDANYKLNKSKTEILSRQFEEGEKAVMKEYHETLKDGRRFVVDESVDSAEFLDICRAFCRNHKDKKGIIILIDHLLLITESERGEDPLKKVSEYTNILRKEFGNVYFVFLSQLNRKVYAEVKDKTNKMVPDSSMIYGSSHFEFLSAFAVIMLNPFKMGVDYYMSIKKDRYPDLQEFMTIEDSKGKVHFNTLGNMFYHLVKIRESDKMYDNLHIEKMKLSDKQLEKMKMDSESKKEEESVVTSPPPVFEPQAVFDATVSEPGNLNRFAGFDNEN